MTTAYDHSTLVVRSRTRPSSSSAPVGAPQGPVSKTGYDIGYGKPPRHSQFKKGRSGNPKGRPKGSKNFDTIVLEAMQKRVKVRTASGVKTMSSAEALMMKFMEAATKGDRRMIERLFAWYAQALPTPVMANREIADQDEPLSNGDHAILEAYREMVLRQGQDEEDGPEGKPA